MTNETARNNLTMATHEAAVKNWSAMPIKSVGTGSTVFRGLNAKYGHATARAARRMPIGASKNESNRFDGTVAPGIKCGALNTATDEQGALNENFALLRTIGPPILKSDHIRGSDFDVSHPGARSLIELTKKRPMFQFRLARRKEVANFHSNSLRFREFLRKVEDDSGVQAARRDLAKVGWARESSSQDFLGAVVLPNDYSRPITRALGVAALLNSNVQGLEADCVRHEVGGQDPSEGNLFLKGTEGQELTELVPVARISAEIGTDGREHLHYDPVKSLDE